MKSLGAFIATGIGSTPHIDPRSAIDLIMADIAEIPFWPQLPKRGFDEGMGGQYIGSVPGIEVNRKKNSIFIDTSIDYSDAMEVFFQNYLDKNYNHFAIDKGVAAGLYSFLDRLETHGTGGARYLKGHITGPITFGSLVKDESGKDIIHNEIYYDCILKNLAMKAAWQVDILKKYHLPVIIFLDEPSMVSFGSAYSTLSRDEVLEIWNEVIDEIHEVGGIAAIHCCGNTDWGLLFESRCDIVNFDSIDFFDKMMLYSGQLKDYLAAGRKLAWGGVPTDDRITGENTGSLKDKLTDSVNRLVAAGVPLRDIVDNSMLTPSCGMGTLDVKIAGQVIAITGELSRLMKQEYAG